MDIDSDKEPIRILVIAGCAVAYTPVVKAYISYAQGNNCQVDVIEYKNFRRTRFVVDAFYRLFTKKYSKIVCVNHQSLPILLLLSWLSSKPLVFWKLESYKLFENWSIALNLQLLEYILNRDSVSLIVPTSFRAKIQAPRFDHTYILPNAPISPYIKNDTALRKFHPENIKLVLYGTIHRNESVFLNEWVDFCERTSNCELTVIGKNGLATHRVSWRGKLKHDLLIDELCDHNKFTFSLVGYQAIGQNNKYAAPNKLIESLACGLPVIGHADNPYIVDLIDQYGCGLVVDFGKLDTFALDLSHEKYAELAQAAINTAKHLCLSNTVLSTPLRCN